jgi:hypothetical protein
MTTIQDLQKEIETIKERNQKVELDKKWETSWTRKLSILILTYFAVVIFFIAIGLVDPFINGIVPTLGFFISTLSLPVIKKLWIKKNLPKIVIGIQGGIGSTNERACKFFARKYGWKNFEIKYLISTENVLNALQKGEIQYGTFAWESTRGGLVTETQEATKKYSYLKIDEEKFQLDHAILCNSSIDKTKPVQIHTHPQALKEHKPFLIKEFKDPILIEEIDTAIAAKKMQNNEYPPNSGIIAPITCAEIYSLEIYLADIPTNQGYLTTIYIAEREDTETM